jgi:hypothetical protein
MARKKTIKKQKNPKTMIYTTLHRNLKIIKPESHRGRRFVNQRQYRQLNSKLN